jgi:hypothetical protein
VRTTAALARLAEHYAEVSAGERGSWISMARAAGRNGCTLRALPTARPPSAKRCGEGSGPRLRPLRWPGAKGAERREVRRIHYQRSENEYPERAPREPHPKNPIVGGSVSQGRIYRGV